MKISPVCLKNTGLSHQPCDRSTYENGRLQKPNGPFYGEITEIEIYHIIQEELQDLYAFCAYIHDVLKEPTKYNLSAE